MLRQHRGAFTGALGESKRPPERVANRKPVDASAVGKAFGVALAGADAVPLVVPDRRHKEPNGGG